MVSGSDRHAHDWQQRLRIPGAEALTLEHAYKAMAWLGETVADGRWMTDVIEEALYRHRQPLFGELSVAFFEVPSGMWWKWVGGVVSGSLQRAISGVGAPAETTPWNRIARERKRTARRCLQGTPGLTRSRRAFGSECAGSLKS